MKTLRATATELIGAHYRDFGPTLACEKLAGLHGIRLPVESARQIMIGAGYWKPRRGERCMLLVFIDDATGKLAQLRFMPTETTLGYMGVLHDHILAHGVPAALYSDKHSIFRINAVDADPGAETQFSRAARELGIGCIHAHSPQAKGRVERANQTLQDRLVKEMRLAGINDMGTANAWLPGYIEDYNRRFAVKPKDASGAHLAYPGIREALVRILSVQVTKTLSKNLSCQHENKLPQIATTGAGLGLRGEKARYTNTLTAAGSCSGRSANCAYSVMDKPQRQPPAADGKSVNALADKAMARRNTGHKPAPDHPWRKMAVGKPAHDRQCATS